MIFKQHFVRLGVPNLYK